MDSNRINITFWGVRGSCPASTVYTQKFGGNTSCVQVELQNKLFIFDAGTGIVQLGKNLFDLNKEIKADIFISHPHWDHIQGFPFFAPAYKKGNHFSIYGEAKGGHSLEALVKDIMKEPYFPTKWEAMQADFSFKEIKGNERIEFGNGISIHTLSLNHPGGCLGYRISYENKSCCYATDIEYKESDSLFKSFIKDADILILDTQFTEDEYYSNNPASSKVGWGHSTWQKAVQLSEEMNVKRLVLFHHDINHSDSELEEIEEKAKKIHSNTVAAFEGLTISL